MSSNLYHFSFDVFPTDMVAFLNTECRFNYRPQESGKQVRMQGAYLREYTRTYLCGWVHSYVDKV